MNRIISLLCLVCCLALSATAGRAADEKLLIVVLDKVTWSDILAQEADLPVITGLARTGAVGMMCVRTARGYGGEYLTIGAGSRAASRFDADKHQNAAGEAYDAAEIVDGAPAEILYRARTGWPRGDNAIVHLAIGDLIRQNAESEYPLRLGLLGGALQRKGLRVACVGNADTLANVHRELVAIGMDEQGLVELGDVGTDLNRADPARPSGLATNSAALLAALRRAVARADVIVFDPGVTSRVEAEAEHMTPSAATAARGRALATADRLLGQALAELPKEQWAVLVLTPSLRNPAPGESFAALTPIIVAAPNSTSALLASPSTHRPGLVVNTDVAPTVLDHFGIALPPEVVGRPMTLEPMAGSALARVAADVSRHDAVETVRRRVFRLLPILSAIALWVAAFLLLLGERVPGGVRGLLRGLLLLLLSAPAAMLLVSFRALPAAQLGLAVVGLSVLIALISSWITGHRSGHVIPMLLAVGLLVYDLFRGQQLLYWSPFSYSPAAGARFYGIGNEYAGALLGASVMGGGALLWPRDKSGFGERFLVGAGLLGLAALVGAPRFGANLGMSLALGVAAAIFILYLWRSDPGWPEAVGLILVAAALVAGAVVLDYLLRGSEASHIGRWIGSVRTEGWSAIGSVIARKLSMNWLLVRVSPWTDVAGAALTVLGLAVVARPPKLLAAAQERSWLVPSVTACLAGAAAAFVLNDSGVVAAAVALLYGSGSLAYVGLGEVSPETPVPAPSPTSR